MRGVVYSETLVWSPPAELADLAPYQLVLVDLEDGVRVMGRMSGEDRVRIGDPVVQESADRGLRLFRRE